MHTFPKVDVTTMRRFDWPSNPEYSEIRDGTLSIAIGPTQCSPSVPPTMFANFNDAPVSEPVKKEDENETVRFNNSRDALNDQIRIPPQPTITDKNVIVDTLCLIKIHHS